MFIQIGIGKGKLIFSDFNLCQIFKNRLVFHEINNINNHKQSLLVVGYDLGDLIKKLYSKFKKIRMLTQDFLILSILKMILSGNQP